MSNSLINANITLTIQDQLAATTTAAQTLVDRVVPQFQFPSGNVALYSSYTTMANGVPAVLVGNGVKAYFLFVRCAAVGPVLLSWTPGTGISGGTSVLLVLGGIFLFGNPSQDPTNVDYITTVQVVSTPLSAIEYAVGY